MIHRLKVRLKELWLFSVKSQLIIFLPLLFFFLVNTLQTEFPDEYDNIVGGYYINQGILPYKGFFSHHGPLAYFLASLITLFTGQGFVQFRLVLAIVYFLIILLIFLLLKKYLEISKFNVFIVFAYFLGVTANYFWGHMLLADTLASYMIIGPYVLLLYLLSEKKRITTAHMIIFSVFTSLTILASITYLYLAALFYGILTYIFFTQRKRVDVEFIKFVAILSLPYIIFGLYLLITGSLQEFYKQAILYNKNTYIYNYPRAPGSTTINPVRYAIVIFYNFFQNYRNLLMQAKDFNFSFPFNITLALVNISTVIYFISRRKIVAVLFIFLSLVYANPRSNPLTSGEIDFQSSVYIFISLFNIGFLFATLSQSLSITVSVTLRLLYSSLLIVSGVYIFFFSIYVAGKFTDRLYAKYMGTEPLIYNRPAIAPVINQLTTPNDYVWIGPLEFKELLYIHGRQPSKYHWFLRAHSEMGYIKDEFIQDLIKNKPKIIVYKRDFSPYGDGENTINYALVDLLKKEYTQISDMGSASSSYKAKFIDRNFDMTTDFYFDINYKDEIIQRLAELGYVEVIPQEPV